MNAEKRRGTACHNSCHKNKRIGRKYPMWTIRLWRSFYRQKGAVSKWLKQAMRGSTFFRNIFGQSKTECRKNGTQGIIFIRNSKWNELWNLRTSYRIPSGMSYGTSEHLTANAIRHPFSKRNLYPISECHLHAAVQIDRHPVNRRVP